MLLIVLSYLGGVLTILSPCILPVLPFVFARADQPFVKSGLPLLLGMALTFAGVATLAAIGGGWAVHANQYGRIAALVLLAFFGVTLLSRSLADRLDAPAGRARRPALSKDAGSGAGASLLLGVATGLLWAPCAGPILGLVLTGAAIQGASASTTLLLLAYAAGAATSLAVALLIGGRVFAAMKRSLGAGEWIRRALGVAVLFGVVAIALGWDTGFLTRLSLANTASLEQSLIDKVRPAGAAKITHVAGSDLARRRHIPVARRRDGMDQFAAADAARSARQGRADRFLDLFLHQLSARAALRAGLGRQVQGSRPGRDRRACAGIRVRDAIRTMCAARCAILA